MTFSNSINFVWATPDQLEDVWQLHESMGANWSHPKPFFEESINYNRLLVAQDGKEPIGYLIYQVLWGNTPFLSLLKVSQNHQRNGIGKALIKTLEERLLTLGFESYATSTETTNPNTKNFFPPQGFTQIGELNMQHGGEIFYLKKLI